MLPSINSYILLNRHFLSALGAKETFQNCFKLLQTQAFPCPAPCLRKNSLLPCPSPPLSPSISPHLAVGVLSYLAEKHGLHGCPYKMLLSSCLVFYLGRKTLEEILKAQGKMILENSRSELTLPQRLCTKLSLWSDDQQKNYQGKEL